MAQQKKQLHNLCISVDLLSLMCTDVKSRMLVMLREASRSRDEIEVYVVMY